jgi:hypothetical protein
MGRQIVEKLATPTFGWLYTEEITEVLALALKANCFPAVDISLAAYKNSQRQKPNRLLCVVEKVSLLRLFVRQAELQMALARHAGVGIFRIWLLWGHWKLCKS